MGKRASVARTRRTVKTFFRTHGRAHLPWRHTRSPYRILVSEVMLQQTQVERVVPFYRAFLKAFPTPNALARAPLARVLTVWSGLGYNRRAKFLHQAARQIVERHGGHVPRLYTDLRALSGVGEYTAKAVRVFAHNEPEVLIETNVRTVVVHHFFPRHVQVSEAAIERMARLLAARQEPRVWHAAMMDYGTHIKAVHGNLARKSEAYVRQKAFKGSIREARGALLRALRTPLTKAHAFHACTPLAKAALAEALSALLKEGMVVRTRDVYHLAS